VNVLVEKVVGEDAAIAFATGPFSDRG